LKIPRYERDNIPRAWLVYPTESVDEEKNIVPAVLLDSFAYQGIGVALFN